MELPYLYSLIPLRGAIRSPKWPAARAAWLRKHPECEACGRTYNVEVHHKIPVHVDPSRELDESNFETLCAQSNWFCHFMIGHKGKSWQNYRRDPESAAKAVKAALQIV